MKITVEPTKDFKVLAKLNETVQNWHYELYPEEFKQFNYPKIEEAFEKFLADKNAYAFLAKEEQEAIGYILCFVKSREENAFQYAKTVLYIDQISVDKNFRKRGVAQLLLQKAFALAKENNIQEIQLDHWNENHLASEFFLKNGFQYFKKEMKKSV